MPEGSEFDAIVRTIQRESIVTDEAIERAAFALYMDACEDISAEPQFWDDVDEDVKDDFRSTARLALDAAFGEGDIDLNES